MTRSSRPAVELQRAYEPARGPGSGKRVMVDRIWPRGVSRASLKLDLWLKEIAPSDALRRWFGHDPNRWQEFRRRYLEELKEPERAASLQQLRQLAAKGSVVLIYGARDSEHNQAVVLRQLLMR